MDREQEIDAFSKACHYTGSGTRNFTEKEMNEYLDYVEKRLKGCEVLTTDKFVFALLKTRGKHDCAEQQAEAMRKIMAS